MYGLGLIERSARYRLTGLADVRTERRCDGTIWKHSPAAMASLAWRTMPPGHTLASDHTVDQLQRVGVAQVGGPLTALIHGVVVEDGQRALEPGRHERVARDELATFHALEQETAWSGAEFQQCRNWGF